MRKVKSREELAPRAARKPEPAPQPKPQPEPVARPAAPDPSLVKMQEAVAQMAASMAQLPQLLADAVRPAAPPVPAAPPAPKRPSIFAKKPDPVVPVVMQPVGPITATVKRDKRQRLASVSMSGAVSIEAEVARDGKDRISEMMIERDGVRHRVTLKRNADGYIDTFTIHPATIQPLSNPT